MSIVVATAITTDYLNWDEISRDFMPTNEVSRAYLASFILVMDLFIVMQVSFMLSYIRQVLMWKTDIILRRGGGVNLEKFAMLGDRM